MNQTVKEKKKKVIEIPVPYAYTKCREKEISLCSIYCSVTHQVVPHEYQKMQCCEGNHFIHWSKPGKMSEIF